MSTLTLTAGGRVHATQANEREIGYFLSYADVPRPAAVVAHHDTVYVTVPSIDDLGAWLDATGGTIHRGPSHDGYEHWVLHTHLRTSDGRRLDVRVAALVVAGELVVHHVARAVAA